MRKVNEEDLKQSLGDELCNYCPWMNGDVDIFPCVCGRNYCDEALDNFLEENEQYLDDLEE